MGGRVPYWLHCLRVMGIPTSSLTSSQESLLGYSTFPQPKHPTSKGTLNALDPGCLLMCPGQQEAQPQGIRTHWARSSVINSQPNPGPN